MGPISRFDQDVTVLSVQNRPLKEQQVISFKHNYPRKAKATLDRARPGRTHHLVTHVRDCKTSLAWPNGWLDFMIK